MPPRLDEPGDKGFTRNLGVAYSHNQDRWFGQLRIIKTGTVSGTKGFWRVQTREEDDASPLLHPLHPLHSGPGSENDIASGLGGMKEMKEEKSRDGNENDFQSTGGVNEADEVDESSSSTSYARAGARAHAITHTREGLGSSSASPASSGLALAFDIETGKAQDLFTYTPRDETGFIRLAGMITPDGGPEIVPVPELINHLNSAGEIRGHNILGFDGLALAFHAGLDWEQFAAKAVDTELVARQADPPRSRESGSSEDRYGLSAVAQRLGLPGKTDDLSRLKRKHGGYDKIPLDDPEFRAYLEGDLAATAAVADAMEGDDYTRREHQVAALAGRMTLNGFAVDVPLLRERQRELADRKAAALDQLATGYGLPLAKTVMRGRGKARHEETEALTAPLAAASGREWLAGIYERYGCTNPPRTSHGELAIGRDDLVKLTGHPKCPDELKTIVALMNVITTARTVYQTASDCLCGDGRVHPVNSFRQASGRWSVTNPGLTVFGKRGGRHVERDIFCAEPGYVVITCDLSQVDMRAMAGHCQDPAYMALFEPGKDAHQEIADTLGIARHDAKAIGHGWNYGLGPNRMIKNGLDKRLVYKFTSGMQRRFPRLIAWREEIRAAGKAGQILDNGFGRRMRCDPQRAYTVAPALMGQGPAADILKEWMLNCPREFDKYRLITVHDEQVFQFPEAGWEEVTREVVRASEVISWACRSCAMSAARPQLGGDLSVIRRPWYRRRHGHGPRLVPHPPVNPRGPGTHPPPGRCGTARTIPDTTHDGLPGAMAAIRALPAGDLFAMYDTGSGDIAGTAADWAQIPAGLGHVTIDQGFTGPPRTWPPPSGTARTVPGPCPGPSTAPAETCPGRPCTSAIRTPPRPPGTRAGAVTSGSPGPRTARPRCRPPCRRGSPAWLSSGLTRATGTYPRYSTPPGQGPARPDRPGSPT